MLSILSNKNLNNKMITIIKYKLYYKYKKKKKKLTKESI